MTKKTMPHCICRIKACLRWLTLRPPPPPFKHTRKHTNTQTKTPPKTTTKAEAAQRVASVTVAATGETYAVQEWCDRGDGLALASLLVQEDFILLQRRPSAPSATFCYVFVAGAAGFAFSEVGLRGERGFMKLGQPLQFIHTQVPGFSEHTYSMVAQGFDKLKPEKPYWRSNWSLAPSGALSPFEEEISKEAAAAAAAAAAAKAEPVAETEAGSASSSRGGRKGGGSIAGVAGVAGPLDGAANQNVAAIGTKKPPPRKEAAVHGGFSRLDGSTSGVVYSTAGVAPKDLWLKVEHQTIHKLVTHSDCVLFTVRTYADTLETVARDRDVGAKTCTMLAAVIQSLPPAQLEYRDLADADRRKALLHYLDEQAEE